MHGHYCANRENEKGKTLDFEQITGRNTIYRAINYQTSPDENFFTFVSIFPHHHIFQFSKLDFHCNPYTVAVQNEW